MIFVGPSLGGALVAMAAADFGLRYPNRRFSVYSFGGPRPGDKAFAEWFATLSNVTFERATTADDPLPHAPRLLQGFVHLDSSQERWFPTIDAAMKQKTPKTCPPGGNAECSNLQKGATSLADARARFIGDKFDQCGVPAKVMNQIMDWSKSAFGTVADKFIASEHGVAVLAKKTEADALAKSTQLMNALTPDGQRTLDAAADKEKKVEAAGSDAVDTGKDLGGKVVNGIENLGKKILGNRAPRQRPAPPPAMCEYPLLSRTGREQSVRQPSLAGIATRAARFGNKVGYAHARGRPSTPRRFMRRSRGDRAELAGRF